jgi:hypothetical protein
VENFTQKLELAALPSVRFRFAIHSQSEGECQAILSLKVVIATVGILANGFASDCLPSWQSRDETLQRREAVCQKQGFPQISEIHVRLSFDVEGEHPVNECNRDLSQRYGSRDGGSKRKIHLICIFPNSNLASRNTSMRRWYREVWREGKNQTIYELVASDARLHARFGQNTLIRRRKMGKSTPLARKKEPCPPITRESRATDSQSVYRELLIVVTLASAFSTIVSRVESI